MTFLFTMLAFLVIAGPPMLYGAYREGKRRRARIAKAKDMLDEQTRRLAEQGMRHQSDNERLRSELVMARAAYESERAKGHDDHGPQWRREPPTHAEVGEAGSWWWVRSSNHRRQVIHLLQTFDIDGMIVYGDVCDDVHSGVFRSDDWGPDAEWCLCLPPEDSLPIGDP